MSDEHDIVSPCNNVSDCIEIDSQRILTAAWESRQRQQSTMMEHQATGMNSFDYCKYMRVRIYPLTEFGLHPARPTSSGYHLVSLATASIILIAIIHCFMGVARRSCDFILRYTRAIFLLAHQMQPAQSHAFLLSNMNKIPTTMETALRYLNLQANLDFYVVCPSCSTLYAQSNPTTPEVWNARDLDGADCHAPLFDSNHRGTST
jgi:hypothetical protein